MSTLYEIHVSVNVGPIEELRWTWFCKENKWKCIRVINNKGTHPVQNMIAKWCSRPTAAQAIECANRIAKIIKEAGFDVVRVKTEGMMMNQQFDGVCLSGEKGVYWEFHFKIDISNTADLGKLFHWKENTELPFARNLGLSVSSSGNTKFPIITLRLSHGTREDAIRKKDEAIAELKNLGFNIHNKLQAECSIYDTYPEEDEGWVV